MQAQYEGLLGSRITLQQDIFTGGAQQPVFCIWRDGFAGVVKAQLGLQLFSAGVFELGALHIQPARRLCLHDIQLQAGGQAQALSRGLALEFRCQPQGL